MAPLPRAAERALLRPLAAADALCNRLYGSRANPLYQSGTIVVALLVVVVVTGLPLLLLYRIGAPYASVAAIAADPWLGRWVRGVHRYASDAAVVFTLVHAWRMVAQGRSWGPRALAWTSGVLALGVLLVCGLTGYVLVWDVFGQLLAREGARMLDALPILSEPLGRAFTGEREMAGAFFFVTLFAHIALPLGMGLVLWVHVSRVARPALLPPRPLLRGVVGLVVAAALLRPAVLAPEASAFRLPATVPVDVLFAFWLPLVRALPGGAALAVLAAAVAALLAVPLATRRPASAAPPPSVVDEELCTGCRQCALDCPYDAIAMIARDPASASAARSAEVARVNPELCVSCGICAGSCAPMGVGPPGLTGRDQLKRVRAFVHEAHVDDGRPVVACCDRGARGWRAAVETEGAAVYDVDCAGSLHTSVIELLLRGGAAGVLVVACPSRDCWNREGATWLEQRMYHDREAELQARVDRRRVRLVHASARERRAVVAALRAFRADLAALRVPGADPGAVLERECEPAAASGRERA